MAEFDNGLPPQGIDTTEYEINSIRLSKEEPDENAQTISAVLIGKEEAQEASISSISAVLMDKTAAEVATVYSINRVLMDKSESEYRNRNMFL